MFKKWFQKSQEEISLNIDKNGELKIKLPENVEEERIAQVLHDLVTGTYNSEIMMDLSESMDDMAYGRLVDHLVSMEREMEYSRMTEHLNEMPLINPTQVLVNSSTQLRNEQ